MIHTHPNGSAISMVIINNNKNNNEMVGNYINNNNYYFGWFLKNIWIVMLIPAHEEGYNSIRTKNQPK